MSERISLLFFSLSFFFSFFFFLVMRIELRGASTLSHFPWTNLFIHAATVKCLRPHTCSFFWPALFYCPLNFFSRGNVDPACLSLPDYCCSNRSHLLSRWLGSFHPLLLVVSGLPTVLSSRLRSSAPSGQKASSLL